MCCCFLVPVFDFVACETDGGRLDIMSLCVLLQKVLSEMQAENQQRLKNREQELKDLKTVLGAMKVGQQSYPWHKVWVCST